MLNRIYRMRPGLARWLPETLLQCPPSMQRRASSMLFAAVVISCPATALAHGGEQLLAAYFMVAAAAVATPLIAFAAFYAVLAITRRAGLVRSPKKIAGVACLLALVTVVTVPSWVLPFSLRVRLAAMDRLFPNFRETGFRQDEVARLINAMGRESEVSIHLQAEEILSKFGAPAVPQLTAALDSPDEWIRGGAASALTQIGPPSRVAIPRVIKMLAEEHDSYVQIYALFFLEQAASWGDRQSWVEDALPVVISYLSHSSHLPGNAANALAAMKTDAAPALPDLRKALDGRTGTSGDDAFVRQSLSKAITSISSSSGAASGNNSDRREQSPSALPTM